MIGARGGATRLRADSSTRDHIKTGQTTLRFRDAEGRLVAVRLRPQQFGTLATGVLGPARTREVVAYPEHP